MTHTQLGLILGALGVLLSAIALGPIALGATAIFLVGLMVSELARRASS
ncbi:MAG TPA: hypothetical protein VF529_09555 [Solirubrobacteraceae bacterium]|jgi:hypothetical protein